MVQFICDDPEVEKCLKKLYELVKSEGAYLHDSLLFICENNYLHVESTEPFSVADEIIMVPQTCLSPFEVSDFSAQGNDIVFMPSADQSDLHIQIFELVTDLYNLTGKFKDYKKNSVTSLFYEDKALFDELIKGYRMPILEQHESLSKDDIFCQSFMNTRRIMCPFLKHKDGSQESEQRGQKGIGIFVPFVDCFDHHPDACELLVNLDQQSNEVSMNISASPGLDPKNVYLHYGLHDAHDLLMRHDYADTKVEQTRSVSIEFEIPDLGTFSIDPTLSGMSYTSLPASVQDLQFYMPIVNVDQYTKKIGLSFLYIPSEYAPMAMRRVLEFLFSQMTGSQEGLRRAVRFAESAIIQENLRYYGALLEMLNHSKVLDTTSVIVQNAKIVAETQIRNIKAYSFFEEAIALGHAA